MALKILIVDDDATVLAVTQALLEALGHTVIVRDSALGTTAAILQEKPDVVLLDLEMPALSGDQLMHLARQRADLEHTRFILYSGKRTEIVHEVAERVGAVGAIVKSGDLDTFVAEFQRLVTETGIEQAP